MPRFLHLEQKKQSLCGFAFVDVFLKALRVVLRLVWGGGAVFVIPTAVGFFALFAHVNAGHTGILALEFSKLKNAVAGNPFGGAGFFGYVYDTV